ncbi:hypothetical protein [uncultured Desulfovibrio sp.]|uniref:hypothetical protein n=1 Tax=uncultured Desulfovibrio sp. TaxID=167968 RepID=UPI00280635FE|nr:hypothetical protein [uncultured Desulfovibrio sp.]
MEKKKYIFTLTVKGDDSDTLSISLDFSPELKQHAASIPSAYACGLMLSRVVLLLATPNDFGKELRALIDRYSLTEGGKEPGQEASHE